MTLHVENAFVFRKRITLLFVIKQKPKQTISNRQKTQHYSTLKMGQDSRSGGKPGCSGEGCQQTFVRFLFVIIALLVGVMIWMDTDEAKFMGTVINTFAATFTVGGQLLSHLTT